MRGAWAQLISVRRQCQLLGLSRSGLYYQPAGESPGKLILMRLVDEQYTRTPVYGVWRMPAWLKPQGYQSSPKLPLLQCGINSTLGLLH